MVFMSNPIVFILHSYVKETNLKNVRVQCFSDFSQIEYMQVLNESVNGLQIVSTMYLLKISNFIHEIQMNERIILVDLCENDLMNKC